MTPTVYLVTEANLGIGLEIVTQLASRPSSIIFACAHNPNSATALHKLAAVHPERVHIAKLTSGSAEDIATVIETIRKVVGRLDVVIAIANDELRTERLREHDDVDVVCLHRTLFLQILPLLRLRGGGRYKSSHTTKYEPPSSPPKFIVVSSSVAVNFLVRKVHSEHGDDGLVTFTVCPGPVNTDLLNFNRTKARSDTVDMPNYFDGAAQEHSVNGILRVLSLLRVVGTATRDTHGGRFFDYAGVCLPW